MAGVNGLFTVLAVFATGVPAYFLKKLSPTELAGTKDVEATTGGSKFFIRPWLLLVSSLAIFIHLQGDYNAFKLLTHYGFQKVEIGNILFVEIAGSAVLGPLIASLGDTLQYKNVLLVSVLVGSLGSLAHHDHGVFTLHITRVLTASVAIAIPIVVQSWYLSMFRQDGGDLPASINMTNPLGNALRQSSLKVLVVVCLAVTATAHGSMPILLATGFNGSFDVAAVVGLAVMFLLTKQMPNEPPNAKKGFHLVEAWVAISSEPSLLLLGLLHVSFSSAITLVHLSWIPLIEASFNKEIPYGMAVHVVSGMVAVGALVPEKLKPGSSSQWLSEKLTQALQGGGAALILAMFLCRKDVPGPAIVVLLVYLAVAACSGVFLVTIVSLNHHFVPQHLLCSTLAWYSVPTTIVALLASLNISMASYSKICAMAGVLLICSAFAHSKLVKLHRMG